MNQSLTINTALEETKIRDYISLLKPRVMSLVVFTGFVGLYLAPGDIHPFLAIIAVFCIALGSGAAGAINMWMERERDGLMRRTKNRPLPAGRLQADSAIEFAVVLAVASIFIMAVAVNFLAAFLLLAAILFYVFIYTYWLKPRTPQNIVIGGAAGAFPALIGWAAVTGQVSVEPLLLFLIVFFWTPPHFWALSLYSCEDYAKAGIPMLPVVKGERSTKNHIVFYSLILVPLSFAPQLTILGGTIYGIGTAVLGALFLFHAFRVWAYEDKKYAQIMFGYSIIYLFLLFGLLIAQKIAGI